ncbi:hypothetical protein Y032_0502g2624 [Ancylostoma ceylanicum]|uniref:Uncharacterized protein n=1 Tax=Ancylostoma ceylanicum TaxID=53326 RepID=A0A016WTZ7_9BILA|nr:hypothetical protein Y032_0502g2624 [Ancylostoma ceylanicum]
MKLRVVLKGYVKTALIVLLLPKDECDKSPVNQHDRNRRPCMRRTQPFGNDANVYLREAAATTTAWFLCAHFDTKRFCTASRAG